MYGSDALGLMEADEGQWENGCHPGITGFLVQLDLAQRVHKAGNGVAIEKLTCLVQESDGVGRKVTGE